MIDSHKFPTKLPAVTFTVLLMAKLDLLDNVIRAKLQLIARRYGDVNVIWKFYTHDQLSDKLLISSLDRAGLDPGRDAELVQRLLPKILASFQE